MTAINDKVIVENGRFVSEARAEEEARSTEAGFLAALAFLLRDTIVRLEETVGHISGIVANGRDNLARDLVVALQDFDRLQQELVALENALARYGAVAEKASCASCRNERSIDWGRDIAATITIGDLKERFLRLLDEAAHNPHGLAEGEDVVF